MTRCWHPLGCQVLDAGYWLPRWDLNPVSQVQALLRSLGRRRAEGGLPCPPPRKASVVSPPLLPAQSLTWGLSRHGAGHFMLAITVRVHGRHVASWDGSGHGGPVAEEGVTPRPARKAGVPGPAPGCVPRLPPGLTRYSEGWKPLWGVGEREGEKPEWRVCCYLDLDSSIFKSHVKQPGQPAALLLFSTSLSLVGAWRRGRSRRAWSVAAL